MNELGIGLSEDHLSVSESELDQMMAELGKGDRKMVELGDGLSEEEHLLILEAELVRKEEEMARLIAELSVAKKMAEMTEKLSESVDEKKKRIIELVRECVVQGGKIEELEAQVKTLKADLRAVLSDKELEIREIKKQTREEILEVHHRVKNSLQLAASFIRMRGRKIKDDDAKRALEEVGGEIATIAIVHELLQSGSSREIKMLGYITKIVSPYENMREGIEVSKDIPADILLPAKKAVPVALIINELVTNALKYAFMGGVKGEVKVAMRPENTSYGCQGRRLGVVAKDNRAMPIKLVVSDDGIGLPEDFNPYESESLGMRIVKLLVEDQLDGGIGFYSDKRGTKFTIRFEI